MTEDAVSNSVDANKATFQSNNDEVGTAGIPMPLDSNNSIGASSLGEGSSFSDAWQKAQAALRKIAPNAPSGSSDVKTSYMGNNAQTYQDMQAYMMQYYPWVARSGYGVPYPSPRNFQQNFDPNAYMNSYLFYGGSMRPPRPPPPPNTYRPNAPQYSRPTSASSVCPGTSTSATSSFDQQLRPPVRQSFPQQSPKNNFLNRGSLGNNTSPIRFNIGRPRAVPPSSLNNNVLQKKTIPENVRAYVERAYMALEKEEDRNKLEEYLKKKLNPLLASGAAKTVDWDKEPLPSEVNFELKVDWTPANELRKAAKANTREVTISSWQTTSKNGQSLAFTPSPLRKKEKKRRARSSSRHVSSERSSSEDEPRSSKALRKDSKKQKKRKRIGGKTKWSADARSDSRREERARRFARDEDSTRHIRQSEMRKRLEQESNSMDVPEIIVGTSSDIEKPFFRLTTAPDPSTVRPLHILKRALKLVQRKYAENGDYLYANNQLKSIRQDLMIQCIRTDFTVSVYETNARIAIERSDREEFNQCQSQLKLLYAEVPNSPNEFEFTSYRLLYYIAAANTIDQTTLLHELKDEARKDSCVKYALRVREAWALSNYVRLFKLYEEAPRMASYVMDLFMERERKAAVTSFLKSYRPSISVSALMKKLLMSEKDLCVWLEKLGLKIQNGTLDCRLYNNTLG